jgi:hypothetical protein
MRAGIHVPFEIEPSYNIAPMTYQPVVRLDHDTDERVGADALGIGAFLGARCKRQLFDH